ncbi:response regulator transcription factor [Lysobacter panacisoli]|uniref:Response regulator transcription factor n=1 Tax=Lysobacter panacisoli TaxID=1255263 RepID=A0ABP9LDD9_9GAMM
MPVAAVVHIVDDDPSVLTALGRVLASDGMDVALSASTQEFLGSFDAATTGCIVLDLSMPGMDGLELQTRLAELGATQPVIFLTGCGDIASSVRAMKAGAIDFLTKPVDVDALLEAVRRGLDMDAKAREQLLEERRAQALLTTLSPREYEVLPHVLAGRLNKQIASDLGIAEKTVKAHRARIMQKLGMHSVAELVRFSEHAHVPVAACGRGREPVR